jgi:hypothetical protein
MVQLRVLSAENESLRGRRAWGGQVVTSQLITSVLLPFWLPVPRYACFNKNPCAIIQVLYFVCP